MDKTTVGDKILRNTEVIIDITIAGIQTSLFFE
jgi:hypothetical protein